MHCLDVLVKTSDGLVRNVLKESRLADLLRLRHQEFNSGQLILQSASRPHQAASVAKLRQQLCHPSGAVAEKEDQTEVH
ncbi:hypothetical protein TNCT_470061 [Trichonephila clavata]|uniref:Uncharacterized protein n=1 Tax=Trichonephila clavata TaxID=2740835 RepID=A0A8X6IY93_TRICU|nr:hypothetical protein TNCT_470061 [Trichonephila clavata]